MFLEACRSSQSHTLHDVNNNVLSKDEPLDPSIHLSPVLLGNVMNLEPRNGLLVLQSKPRKTNYESSRFHDKLLKTMGD